MLKKLKHTFKHSFVYSLGNLAVKIIGLILLPMYSEHITVAEYGIFSILETTGLFLVTIFSLNISNGMMRWWADSNDDQERKSYVFTTFIVSVVAIILMNISLQSFSGLFADVFFDNHDFTIYFQILFVSVGFDILNKYLFSLIRILEKSTLYIFVNSVKLIVILSLNIYFIIALNMGVKGIILAQLIGHIVGFLLLLPLLIKNIVIKLQLNVLGKMLAYSAPLAFTALSGVLFNMGDRYVLKFLTDDARVGIYSLAYKIAGFLNFFVLQSFQMAFLPIAYKMYKEPNAKRFFSKVFTYLVMGLTFGALGLSLFSQEFVQLFTPNNQNYWEAAKYVSLISVTVVLLGIRYMFSLNFRFSKHTFFLAVYVTLFAAINILLNFFMIAKLDIHGAILSSILVNIILNVIYYFSGKKLFYVNYEIGKVILILLLGVGLYSVSFLLNDFAFWSKMALKLIILSIFPVVIFFGGFLESIEKQRITESIRKWSNFKNLKSNLKK
ncbi:MAG: oligosaccharide flippase family protein [Bacteroidales bacterium]|nr:oligosaccharide flippase family protein [Bacteroidales bacterium]